MSKSRHIPERSCVACGVKMAKGQLTRIVRSAQGSVMVDTTSHAPGRGAYLCRSPECWDRAVGKGALNRSLGHEIASNDLTQLRTYYQEKIAQ